LRVTHIGDIPQTTPSRLSCKSAILHFQSTKGSGYDQYEINHWEVVVENQAATDHNVTGTRFSGNEPNPEQDSGAAHEAVIGAALESKAANAPRRRPLKLEFVIDEARKLLTEVGLDSMSLRGLASRLGVTAPALYAHVDDKNDLIRRLGEDGYLRLLNRFKPLPEGSPLDRIHHIATTYVNFARENPEQFRTMFMFRPDIPGIIEGEELNHAGETFSIAMDAVNEAIDAGLIESDNAIMTNLTIWGAVHGMTTVILAAGCQFGSDMGNVLIDNIVNSILRGMAPSGAAGNADA
jgi:AcrR family transcriptional regulator